MRNLRLDEDDGCVADAATNANVAISAEAAKLECIGQCKGRRDGEQCAVSGEICHPALNELARGEHDVRRNVSLLPDRAAAFNAAVAGWLSLAERHLG